MPNNYLQERADVGVYVKNLSSITVSNADHMQKIMEFGNKNRMLEIQINLKLDFRKGWGNNDECGE